VEDPKGSEIKDEKEGVNTKWLTPGRLCFILLECMGWSNFLFMGNARLLPTQNCYGMVVEENERMMYFNFWD